MKHLLMTSLLSLIALAGISQSKIAGMVMDKNGSPIANAKITLEGTQFVTSSDFNGKFTFVKVPNDNYTIVISSIYYQTQKSSLEITGDTDNLSYTLEDKLLDALSVKGVSLKAIDAPVAHTNVDMVELRKRNLGQDIPVLLQYTPSLVMTTDAGAGVGYTGLRIRGSDASRINVTFNGIPVNDMESQGVFWVNTPDLASSTDDIEIQRGVGTSTNGAGAFGATINITTQTYRDSAYGELNNSFGSYNTRKHTALFGTGLINNHWSFDGRLSGIFSDGYVDRASSDLRSYYLSGGYYGDKTSVQAITFAGKERTYQSWWGVPEAVLTGDREDLDNHYWNNAGSYDTYEDSVNLYDAGRTYNYYTYENEVDNYNQDHYQLHVSHALSDNFKFKVSGFYTYGRGYFEQFRRDDDIADYGYEPVEFTDPGDTIFIENPFSPGDTLFYDVNGDTTFTIDQTDLVRRRWLDNQFYGSVFNFNYSKSRVDLTLGGAWSKYEGDHFGEVIWAQYAPDGMIYDRYYDNTAIKTDMNVYLKAGIWITEALKVYGDVQLRNVSYSANGIDSDQRNINVDTSFAFFNPKLGLSYRINSNHKFAGSFAVANREPVRNDFIDAQPGEVPGHESLYDGELSYTYTSKNLMVGANLYYMMYKNQLVLTGALNDVGSPIRTNVDDSYRRGVELYFAAQPFKKFKWQGNLTYSQNKIASYTDVVYDYTTGFDVIETEFTNTDISFSPSIIAANQFSYEVIDGLEIGLNTKYVGDQYLDNTSSEDRKIDAYLVNDVLISYNTKLGGIKELGVNLLINNVLNEMYSSNGYTYGYIFGDRIQENFYYPQAGINFLAGLSLKF